MKIVHDYVSIFLNRLLEYPDLHSKLCHIQGKTSVSLPRDMEANNFPISHDWRVHQSILHIAYGKGRYCLCSANLQKK